MENKVIYYKNRPLKISFLINKQENSLEDVFQIIEYCTSLWGGRYNQISFVEKKGKSTYMKEYEREKMTNFDADIVISLCFLSKSFQNKIMAQNAPLKIVTMDKLKHNGDYQFHRHIKGVTTMPTPQYLSLLGYGNPQLINFNTKKLDNPSLQSFFKVNFGFFDDHFSIYKTYLSQCNNKEIEVTEDNIRSIFDSFGRGSNIAFPNQISSIPYQVANVNYSYMQETIIVVIGNQVDDLAYTRNSHLYNTEFRSKFINTYRLPPECSSTLLKTMFTYLRNLSQIVSNDHLRKIVVTSSHLTESELSEILQPIANTQILFEIKTFAEVNKVVKFESIRNPYDISGYNYVLYSSPNERFKLDKPDIPQSTYVNEDYMIDLFMEYETIDNIYTGNYDNLKLYRQFYRNNNAIRSYFSGRMSRVLKGRFPSVLADKGEGFSGFNTSSKDLDSRPLIKLNLPTSSFHFFRTGLICPVVSTTDERPALDFNFGSVDLGEEGAKLRAVLSLFNNDLLFLGAIIKNPEMKNLLLEMSKIRGNDESFQKSIQECVQKEAARSKGNIDSDELAHKVYRVTKGYEGQTKERTFTISTIKKKIGKNNLRLIDHLTEYNILLQGLKPRCLNCGQKARYSLDELKQELLCKGCKKSIQLSLNEPRQYKLNSLLYGNKSIFPILETITDLGNHISDSFIYFGGLEVRTKKGNRFSDIDILAIVDGDFYIGEVKFSRGLLSQGDIKKIFKIAEKCLPDYVIISAYGKIKDLGGNKASDLQKKIDNLKSDLDKLSIKLIIKEM